MFFQSRFLDLLFLFFSFYFFKNCRFGDPLQNPMGSERAQKNDQWAPEGGKKHKLLAHFCAPCFHETIVITVPLRHRGFFKYIFSIEIGEVSVLVAFRCALFYTTILSFFCTTSVNAQPLNPPFFEEITALKKGVFFSFVCLRFRFFYLFILLLTFWYPLPTPWARWAPFWIDCGAIVGLTFPRFPPPALNSCRDFARNHNSRHTQHESCYFYEVSLFFQSLKLTTTPNDARNVPRSHV